MEGMVRVVESGCEVSNGIILFGAGSAGKYALKHLREQGVEPVSFADNDCRKWDTKIDGVDVGSPKDLSVMADVVWVCCAISRPAATEIRAQLKAMGVKTKPLWECLPVCHGLPPLNACGTINNGIEDAEFLADRESYLEWMDQCQFRSDPDYGRQRDPSPISELYFPDFITHREDEHFVDCGACDGDTVRAFLGRWSHWSLITAFEPDKENYTKLRSLGVVDGEWIDTRNKAVGDTRGVLAFQANGDYSSHLSAHVSQPATTMVECVKLDESNLRIPPTYIKMDIEGAELQALWGARKLIKEHSPVLAICAYHESDHLWEIPLLIHAINPEYRLFLRRYAEGAYELVWYAVPPERVK